MGVRPSRKTTELTDVSTTAPADGQVMTWVASTSKWTPQAIPSAPVTSVAGKTGAVTLAQADVSGLTTADSPTFAAATVPTLQKVLSGSFTLPQTITSFYANASANMFPAVPARLTYDLTLSDGSRATVASAIARAPSSTAGAYAGSLTWYAYDYAASRQALVMASDGTQAMLGFYGASAVAKPSGNALTALSTLGLVSTPTLAESDVTNLTADLAAKAPLASPTFTGTVTLPTGLTGVLKAASGVVSTATAGTDYVYPAGVSGGQTVYGDTASGGNLTLVSTSHATKGKVYLNGSSSYVDGTGRINVGNATFAGSDFVLALGSSNPSTQAQFTSSNGTAYFANYLGNAFMQGAAGCGVQLYAGDGSIVVDCQAASVRLYRPLILTSLYCYVNNNGKPGFILNSAGSNYGFVQNDAADVWSLATGTTLTSAGSPVIQWTKAGQVTLTPLTASTRGLIVKGTASQSAPLVVLQGKSSTTDGRDMASVDAAWTVSTDASRQGKIVLSAANTDSTCPGVTVQASAATGTGADVILSNIRDAADDAAAAALSPAVPVGGVYRTGSTLKIRVS